MIAAPVLAVLWVAAWWALPLACIHFGGHAVNFIGLLSLAAATNTWVAWQVLFSPLENRSAG